jgi:hypothetical protein
MSTSHASHSYEYYCHEDKGVLLPSTANQEYFGQWPSNALLGVQSTNVYESLPFCSFGHAWDQDFANIPEINRTSSISESSWDAGSISSSRITSSLSPQEFEFGLNLFHPPPGGTQAQFEDASSKTSGLASTAPDIENGTRKRRTMRSNLTPDARHELLLKNNRIAADKCRKKQAHCERQLRERFKAVESRRNSLINEVASLTESLLSLKEILVLHLECDDREIKRFLFTELETAKMQQTTQAYAQIEHGG